MGKIPVRLTKTADPGFVSLWQVLQILRRTSGALFFLTTSSFLGIEYPMRSTARFASESLRYRYPSIIWYGNVRDSRVIFSDVDSSINLIYASQLLNWLLRRRCTTPASRWLPTESGRGGRRRSRGTLRSFVVVVVFARFLA